jgi:hypothetical protein
MRSLVPDPIVSEAIQLAIMEVVGFLSQDFFKYIQKIILHLGMGIVVKSMDDL